MRWLHLTDIHAGARRGTSHEAALVSMLEDILSVAENESFDAVLLTGDLANTGSAAEYDLLHARLLEPLRNSSSFRSAIFCAVPGNHDLDCRLVFPVTWELLTSVHSTFLEQSPAGTAARKPRASGFDAFRAFLTRASIHGLDPTDSVVQHFHLEERNVDVFAINTCLLCHKDTKDEALIVAPIGALRNALSDAKPRGAVFVLGHHPVSWFRPEQRESFLTVLSQNDALYLHGHEHRVQASFGPRGILTLGFGAALQAALDISEPSFYRNMYAICSLVGTKQMQLRFRAWDPLHGRWTDHTEVPYGLEQVEPRSTIFHVPLSAGKRMALHSGSNEARRSPPILTAIYTISEPTPAQWLSLLRQLRLRPMLSALSDDSLATDTTPERSETRITITEPTGAHRIVCFGSPGHILTKAEIVDANTEIDIGNWRSFTIVSLGTMSDDAKRLYAQLRTRKSLEVLTAAETVRSLENDRLQHVFAHIRTLDGAEVSVSLVLAPPSFFLLEVACNTTWFALRDERAQLLKEDDELVHQVRLARPDIIAARYGQIGPDLVTTRGERLFDKAAYLERCARMFDAVKYAGLAAFGVRLVDVPLSRLYVETGADLDDERALNTKMRQAVRDWLDELPLEPNARDQLEQQILQGAGSLGKVEGGAAKSLYQRYGSVLVLGDPGSGKTCFARTEVLSYCRGNTDSWYGRHIPLYVALSEVASMMREDSDFLDVCCAAATRRGCGLDLAEATGALRRGELAIFFDGLDEVVVMDERSRVAKEMSELIETNAPLGNRFVLTSRPAAAQGIRLPTYLKTIQLRGLSEPEMRLLASRVLAMRVSDATLPVTTTPNLSADDTKLIAQLMADCAAVPGIGRLARNPLLLTLLVMIYANSGAPSARRHRVYAQAVQTLAAVRSRQAGQYMFSEADLRRRLGAVALAAYRDPSGILPRKADVVRTIAVAMSEETSEEVGIDRAEAFLREVAEATGLLVIHGDMDDDAASVAFMHHSFLEYYAALGLRDHGYVHELADIVKRSRWHDVLTLLAGVVSDSGELNDLVERVLQVEPEDVAMSSVMVAFECLLEAEVPPEHATRLVLIAAHSSVASGVGSVDEGLREQLGQLLGRLSIATNGRYVGEFLASGLLEKSSVSLNAFFDLSGSVGSAGTLSPIATRAFDQACANTPPEVARNALGAMSRVRELRTENALNLLRLALASSRAVVRLAAVQAVDRESALAAPVWDELISLIVRESSGPIARTAARAAMRAGLAAHADRDKKRDAFLAAVEQIQFGPPMTDSDRLAIACEQDRIEALLASETLADRVLGLRLIPWLSGDPAFARDALMLAARKSSEGSDEQLAALGALVHAHEAREILRLADIDFLATLTRAHLRNVRIAACRVLSRCRNESVALGAVVAATQAAQGRDFRILLRILSQAEGAPAAVEDYLRKRLLETARVRDMSWSQKAEADVLALLRCTQAISWRNGDDIARRSKKLAESFRTPRAVRREAQVAFASTAPPTADSCRTIGEWMSSPDAETRAAAYRAVRRFVERWFAGADSVRGAINELGDLLRLVVQSHGHAVKQSRESSNPSYVPELRWTAVRLREMLESYNEYSQRRLAGVAGGQFTTA